MRAIRSKNTKPELLIRKALHAAGFRFRLHVARLPGKPDIVLPKYKTAIFVHGCFWHGHNCKYFRLPQTRPEFWRDKIEANRARDAKDLELLKGMGWHVILIWECATKPEGPGVRGIMSIVTERLTARPPNAGASLTIISM